ncbi:hypothetical protein CXB51_025659 [Gossypium anomalum]|uniref:HMG box domain-containing protein n=1 Tax=Gossypium anomalum TaxID=47600 RepID=A0A8J6CRR7_9ROSI|nr:hypothetical protein CXB51_025659 [Gossypium anomalum]
MWKSMSEEKFCVAYCSEFMHMHYHYDFDACIYKGKAPYEVKSGQRKEISTNGIGDDHEGEEDEEDEASEEKGQHLKHEEDDDEEEEDDKEEKD